MDNPIKSLGMAPDAFEYKFGLFGSQRVRKEQEIYFNADEGKQFVITRTIYEPNPLHKYAAPLYRLAEWVRVKRGWEGFDKHGYTHKAYLCENENEVISLCKECQSPDIGEQHAGDEGWTVCDSCGSVEQGYVYIHESEDSEY